MFSVLRLRLCVFGSNIVEVDLYSARCLISRSTCWWFVSTFMTWLRWCLKDFSTVKLLFFPLELISHFWGDVLWPCIYSLHPQTSPTSFIDDILNLSFVCLCRCRLTFLFCSVGYNPLLSLLTWCWNVPHLAMRAPSCRPLCLFFHALIIPSAVSYSLAQDISGSCFPVPSLVSPTLLRSRPGPIYCIKEIFGSWKYMYIYRPRTE